MRSQDTKIFRFNKNNSNNNNNKCEELHLVKYIIIINAEELHL
jgi:hypothetical protein